MKTEPAKQTQPLIKLLALDLDDTLLDKDHRISPENARALALAEAAGVHVVLASGRPPAGMWPFARELGMDRREGYLLSYNGASIRNTVTGAEEWGCRLSTDLAGEVWDVCQELGQGLQTYTDDWILVSEDNPWTRRDTELTGVPYRVVDRQAFTAEPLVKILIPAEPPVLQKTIDRISREFRGRCNCFTSKPYFFEILPLEADKGLALRHLAERHGIRREEVMAMGDAMNDHGMISWAGVGVAMANARDEVKAAARWTTSRQHHESGVAEAVWHWVLEPRGIRA